MTREEFNGVVLEVEKAMKAGLTIMYDGDEVIGAGHRGSEEIYIDVLGYGGMSYEEFLAYWGNPLVFEYKSKFTKSDPLFP